MTPESAAKIEKPKGPQGGTVRTIGTIVHGPAHSFEDNLRDLGWVEGKSVTFENTVRRVGLLSAAVCPFVLLLHAAVARPDYATLYDQDTRSA